MSHKLKLNLTDSIQFKPEKSQTGTLNNRITETLEVSIKDLATLITQPHARIFTPHYFEGSRTKENWRSQSVFYLDFDNGTDLNDILTRLAELNLKPNIIYNTLSDSVAKRKYRVIFFLDLLTEDYNTALWIQTNLVEMFGDSDQKCKTVERMVYPGFSILYLDETENSVENIIRIINTYLIGKDHNKTRKAKNIELFSDSFKIIFDADFKINDVDSVEKLPEVIQLKPAKFKELIDNIKILNEFNSGVKLSHMEIFGLATNLQYIRGGLNYMKNVMTNVNKNGGFRRDGSEKNYDSGEFGILTYVRTKKYFPQMLSKFSPYREDHDYHNILGVEKWKRGRVDILQVTPKIKLSKAERLFSDEFLKVIKKINKEDRDDLFTADLTPGYIKEVNVFKVPTGLGKTRQLETVGNCVIAFPTNKLKNEVSDRMLVEHYVTPDYPIFSDDKINEVIQNYINSNLYTESSKIVAKIANDTPVKINKYIFTPNETDVLLAKEYKEINELCRTTTKTILTTHTRAIFDNNFKHDTIIFDECPLNYMVEMGRCSLDFTIFDNTEFKSEVEPIENWLRHKLGFNYIETMPKFTIDNYSRFAEFCAMNSRPDLIRLLDADFIYKDDKTKRNLGDIFFVKKKDIPAKHIIIMSATAPIEIYRYIFGSKLKVTDISNVEKEGKIIQYTTKSWSRSSILNSSEKDLKELNEKIGLRPVITFANFKKMFKNQTPIHFGNVSGYDYLKGQDIAVVGTDNKPLYVYFFYAKIIGMNIQGSDNLLDTRIIEWNGFRFKAMTFENPVLRDIQLSLIESELIQAVGRNRNLRENCETILFSSQPLKISDKFIW